MAFAAVIASRSDASAGTMIGGFLLGGQTCTFQRPASPEGAKMSSAYRWYIADFFGIDLPPRHEIKNSGKGAWHLLTNATIGQKAYDLR